MASWKLVDGEKVKFYANVTDETGKRITATKTIALDGPVDRNELKRQAMEFELSKQKEMGGNGKLD